MPTVDNHDEASRSDYSLYDKEQSSKKPLPKDPTITQQSQAENQSTATTANPTSRDSQDVKPHTSEQDSRKDTPDTSSDVTTITAITTNTTTNTTNRQRTDSLDPHKAQSGVNNNLAATSDPSGSLEHEHATPKDREQPTSKSIRRVGLQPTSYAQVAHTSKDPHHPQRATEGTSAGRGRAAQHPSGRRFQDAAQVPPGYLSEDEQDRTLEIKQQSTQVSGYGQGFVNTFMSIMPTGGPSPPKDKYQLLKEDLLRTRDELKQARLFIDNYDRELRRTQGELRQANQFIGHLQHEIHRSKDSNSGLQNELNNVYQQFEDAKTLSEVRGKELHGAQVFLTKADTLSISEVGEKVTALNEDIFQAAATLGEAVIYKKREVSLTDLEAAAAESRAIVGEKLTNILITQSQKPEPEVNPLLVQVVLQILMVNFCVYKIQSWYPGDSAIDEFLAAIYSQIRSTEEQAVSGRWRALTRANTRPSTEAWIKGLYKGLQSIFVIASWKARSQENEESYGHSLSSIFKAINELRMAIGEKFTSADLNIFIFEGDTAYDPAIMDDAYSDGRQPSGKRAPEAIVGTTGIGLGRREADGAKDVPRHETIIPPKIVLRSTLKEALEPIQSARPRTKKIPVENTADGADREGGHGSSRSKAATNKDLT